MGDGAKKHLSESDMIKKWEEEAKRFADTLSQDDNPVNKFARQRISNDAEDYDPEKTLKAHLAVADEFADDFCRGNS